MTSFRIGALRILLLVLLPIGAHAGDGRIEINQARAQAGGVAIADAAGFPVQIVPGNYVLTSDLVVPAGVAAITSVSGNSDFTIDLNGFSIVGPGTCSGSPVSCTLAPSSIHGISLSGPNVLIRNGTIRGFAGNGVQLNGLSNRVHDLRVEQNAGAGIVVAGPAMISGNTVRLNLDDGIDAGLAPNCLIRDNLVASNGESSIAVSNRCLVLDNIIAGPSPSAEAALVTGLGLGVNASSYHGNVIGGSVTVVGNGVDAGANTCNGSATCP